MPKTRVCGDCKFHLKRGVCPRAEYKSYKDNQIACSTYDTACELFQAKNKETVKHHPGFANNDIVFEQIANEKYACNKNLEEQTIIIHNGVTYQPLERCPWPLATKPTIYSSSQELWKDIYSFIYDHLFLPSKELYDVLTSWVLSTYLRELWTVVPYVFFYGPIASGKTRGLETLRNIAYRGILASNISTAALFRSSEEWHPTLFLDEAEIYNKDTKTEIIGLLNSGYRKGQYAIRVKQTQNSSELKAFDVFGFKALGGTQGLAQSLESRSIMIRMIKSSRKVERTIDEKRATDLRNKLLGWRLYTLTMGELSELSELFTETAETLNFGDGRLQELFTCLLAVADDKKENLIDYAKKLYKTRSFEEKASEEAEIIEILTKKDIIDEKGIALTKDIAEEFNSSRNEKEQWKTRSIGWIMRRLGFDKIHTKNGNGWLLEKERLKYLQEIYGLTNQQDGYTVEKVQQVQKVHAIQIEDNLIYPCYICQKPVPNDLDNCTYLDSKPIHLECYKKLEAQQKNKDLSENPAKELESSSEEYNFRLTQLGDFNP
ncbi:MAG: hypothetical protein P8X91_00700 [Candidatus Bathyarchaeota archaeon]